MRIGYVPQDSFHFHDTLRANLLWARPEASEAELREALDIAAAGFVARLPEGLDTVLGDIGYEVGTYRADAFLLAATPEQKTWTLETFYQSERADRERAVAGLEGLTVTQTFQWDGGSTWSARDPDPQLAARLASYLVGSTVIGDPVPLSPADRERLRALGYGSR